MKTHNRYVCKTCKVAFNSDSSICDGCGTDASKPLTETRDPLRELMDAKAEIRALKSERADLMQQIENLGRFIGRPGMTAAHIVSETVSELEKLRAKVSCQNDQVEAPPRKTPNQEQG